MSPRNTTRFSISKRYSQIPMNREYLPACPCQGIAGCSFLSPPLKPPYRIVMSRCIPELSSGFHSGWYVIQRRMEYASRLHCFLRECRFANAAKGEGAGRVSRIAGGRVGLLRALTLTGILPCSVLRSPADGTSGQVGDVASCVRLSAPISSRAKQFRVTAGPHRRDRQWKGERGTYRAA